MRPINTLFILCFLLSVGQLFGQQKFSLSKTNEISNSTTEHIVKFSSQNLNQISSEQPELFVLEAPLTSTETLSITFEKTNVVKPQLLIRSTTQAPFVLENQGVFYTGKIAGHEFGVAYFSVINDLVTLIINKTGNESYKLEKVESSDTNYKFVYFNGISENLKFSPCQVDNGNPESYNSEASDVTRAAGGTYDVYLEVDYLTFVSGGGSILASVTEMQTLFATVVPLYTAMDGSGVTVNLVLSEIFVHDAPDPYPDAQNFVARRALFDDIVDTEADLAMLVHWSVNNVLNGIAFFDGICSGGGISVAALGDRNDAIVARNQMAHEFAHNLGARHTQCNNYFEDLNQNQGVAIETIGCGAGCDAPPITGIGTTAGNLAQATLMGYCWGPPNAGGNLAGLDPAAPFHWEVVEDMCTVMAACPPSPTCPGDTDCDGIPDSNECLLWSLIPNGEPFVWETELDECDDPLPPASNFASCDDSNSCTINDRIENCECIGDVVDPNGPDGPMIGNSDGTDACVNNTGVCYLTSGIISIPDGTENAGGGATSQFPAVWGGSANLASPDVVDGMARIVHRLNDGSNFHEGIVHPLCCPIENDGSVYNLNLDLAFLPYYNNSGANLIIHGSQNPPTPANGIPVTETSANGFVYLATFELTDALTGNYPQRIVNCPNGPNPTSADFDDFWWSSNIDVNYSVTSQTIPLNVGNLQAMSCEDFGGESLSFIYFTLVADPMNQSHTTNNPLSVCGLDVLGGGSLLMDGISVSVAEPPIILTRITSDIECKSTTQSTETNQCKYGVCEDGDFVLEVTLLDFEPYCLTNDDYLWEFYGKEECPIAKYPGHILSLSNFSSSNAGKYVLTITDGKCGCTNTAEFYVEIAEPTEITCNLFVTDKNNVQEEIETDCELLICENDYKEITFNFGQNLTVYYFQNLFDPNFSIDDAPLISADACYTGTSTIDIGLGLFGTYYIVDNNCSYNTQTFIISPDTPPNPEEVMLVLDCETNNTHSICLSYTGIFANGHDQIEFSIDGGMTWSAGLVQNQEICFDNLPAGKYNIVARWGGTDPSCCIDVDVLDLKVGNLPVTGVAKSSLCDHENGSITLNQTDYDSYLWSNGMTGSKISCLGAGTYTVTVSDDGVCDPTSQTFIVESTNQDIITESGQASGLHVDGIKLPAGTDLTWCFSTYWISDRLIITTAADEGFTTGVKVILDSGNQSSYSSTCCNNTSFPWCSCSANNLRLGDFSNGANLPFLAGNANALITASPCTTGNSSYGTITLEDDVWIKVDVIGQPCVDDPDKDVTQWTLIVTCGAAGDACVEGDEPYIGKETSYLDNAPLLSSNLSEDEVISQVSLMPNPVFDVLKIDLPNFDGKVNAEIVNLSGRQLQSWNFENGQYDLNIQNLSDGIYFLKLKMEDKIVIKKFIVSKN